MNTQAQKDQRQRIDFQKNIVQTQVWATCLNCEFWEKDKGICDKYQAVPPPEVILLSCDDWFGEIPF